MVSAFPITAAALRALSMKELAHVFMDLRHMEDAAGNISNRSCYERMQGIASDAGEIFVDLADFLADQRRLVTEEAGARDPAGADDRAARNFILLTDSINAFEDPLTSIREIAGRFAYGLGGAMGALVTKREG